MLLVWLAVRAEIVGSGREVRSHNSASPIDLGRSDTVQLNRDFPKVRGIVRDKLRSPLVRKFLHCGLPKLSQQCQKWHLVAFDVAVRGGMPRLQRATVDQCDRASSQWLPYSKVSENVAVPTNRVSPVELRTTASATEFACGGLCNRLSLPPV